MPYLGPKKERATEATLDKRLITGYVTQLFRRKDFPKDVYVALDDGATAFKGDVVWAMTDCEHPFDFVPIARIDQLVVNIPTRDEFLLKLGIDRMEDRTPEAESKFWNGYEFEFAETAGNVKITWE